jgi:hypothetical protein
LYALWSTVRLLISAGINFGIETYLYVLECRLFTACYSLQTSPHRLSLRFVHKTQLW